MLEVIAFFLRSGIKISLGLASCLILFQVLDAGRLKKYLWRGAGGSLAVGAALAYPVKFLKIREEFDVVLASLAILLCLLVLIIIWRRLATSLLAKVSAFCAGLLLPMQDFAQMALFPESIFITAKSYLNTELLLKITAGFLGLGVSIFMGILFLRISRFLDKRKAYLPLSIFFISVIAYSMVVIASGALVLGLLPVTTKTVALMAPAINFKQSTFYMLLFMLGAGLVLARNSDGDEKRKDVSRLNPAERRKVKAIGLAKKRWIKVGYLSIAITIALMAADHYWANKKITLSPSKDLTAPDGFISIPVTAVDDGSLHRFSFASGGGSQIRFIVVEKREGVFGMGFDACDICGPRGYYERKKGVIVCLACDVVMNLDTIGLPGGCNPIPLPYKKEGDTLIVKVSDLLDKKEKFRK